MGLESILTSFSSMVIVTFHCIISQLAIVVLVLTIFSCIAAINDSLAPISDSSAVQCTICSKVLSTMGNGRIHVEDMHFPSVVECLKCNVICHSIKKFRNHITGTHKIVGEKNVVKKYGKLVKQPNLTNIDKSPSKIVWG